MINRISDLSVQGISEGVLVLSEVAPAPPLQFFSFWGEAPPRIPNFEFFYLECPINQWEIRYHAT